MKRTVIDHMSDLQKMKIPDAQCSEKIARFLRHMADDLEDGEVFPTLMSTNYHVGAEQTPKGAFTIEFIEPKHRNHERF